MAGTQTKRRQTFRRFRAVAMHTDPETLAHLRIELDDREFHFREVMDRTRGHASLAALKLVSVRHRATGERVGHDKLGTDELPPELVRALVGATYHHVRADAPSDPAPHDKRAITDVVRQTDGRWVALLDPGRDVRMAVRELLREAARGRVRFTSFRSGRPQ